MMITDINYTSQFAVSGMHAIMLSGAGIFPDHSQTRPADILVLHWNLGKPVALDMYISVVSPINPSTLGNLKHLLNKSEGQSHPPKSIEPNLHV